MKKILICDDEEGVRESLRLILEKNYDLLFSSNGIEAMEIVKKSAVDIAIMDIKMPKMDGIETIQNLKRIRPGLKIVVTSGYKSVETAQEAIAAGASDYIVKPFERGDILNAVESLT